MNNPTANVADTTAIADTLHKAAEGGDWIIHHVMNEPMFANDLTFFGLFPIPITKHVFFLFVVSFLMLLVFPLMARKYKKSLVPSGLQNMFETLIVFVKDDIAKPTIGKGYQTFVPYLLTAFFFILFANFLGLVPYTAAITSNISITATLAVFSFLVTQYGGIKHNGFFGYFKGLIPHGLPAPLLIIMIPIEFIGLFTKPFALAIRLFANMLAGKIVVYALIGLIFATVYMIPLSIFMTVAILLLKVLVSFLQAYIFTMLSGLFIGMAVHQEH